MSVVLSASRRLLIEASPETGLETLARRAATAVDTLEAFSPASEDTEAVAPTGWFAARMAPSGPAAHPWDEAHRTLDEPGFVGLESAPAYVEPDVVQRFPYRGPDDVELESFAGSTACRYSGPDAFWPPSTLQFGWHLDDAHSGLRSARDRVGDPSGRRIRIAILDTGYDPEHITRPLHLLNNLQRNFVDGSPGDATDPSRHFPGNQPGHGTATMALLAGNRIRPAQHPFDDFLGGAPHAEVVPVRIADSVIHFQTSAMALGIRYAIDAGCDVVSISMGGVPARSWADAVNRAYEAGIIICAAAGNRIGPSPPSSIVYPGRFRRVVAVCGVTADKSPYFREGLHRKMQGCFGPAPKMDTALAAYTPNMPWAIIGCRELVTDDGGGTSSATPQAAAAAALWLQNASFPTSVAPWQKVEAVRHALFSSADKEVDDVRTFFGQGLLRAQRALDVPIPTDLPMTPRDEVSFPWLRLLGVREIAPSGRDLMYEVESLQIYEQSPSMQAITNGADPLTDDLDAETRKRLFASLRESPLASKALRAHMDEIHRRL